MKLYGPWLFFLLGALFSGSPPAWANATPKAAIFMDQLPGANPALARELADRVTEAGYTAEFLDRTELAQINRLTTTNYALLVLPGARSMPIATAPAIESYLHQGGQLLAAGLPAWQSPLYPVKGQWITPAAYEAVIATQSVAHILFDFGQQNLTNWVRAANDPAAGLRTELVPHGPATALHVTVSNLTSWDTLRGPILSAPPLAGHVLTCFRAKGDAKTPKLVIEWLQTDETRWLATVELTEQWQNYVLTPESFQRWPTPAEKGNHFALAKAKSIAIGLAMSHARMDTGRHEYWIEDIGTAPHPFGDERISDPHPPIIETFSPPYAFYPLGGNLKLATPAGLALVTSTKPKPPTSDQMFAMHPRAGNAGFAQERSWRWQPLLEARARDGDYRGALASLAVNFNNAFRSGIWACFTPDDVKFYQQPAMKRLLGEILGQFRRGLFLREGGSEFFTVFDDQTFRVGARAANLSGETRSNLVVRLKVTSIRDGKTFFSREWPLDLAAGAEKTFEELWRPTTWPQGGFQITTELAERTGPKDFYVIDRLTHELNVWKPKAKPEFIQTRDGRFWAEGKPWKINGVNYMPSSGIALNSSYFEHWVGRGAYDPVIIDRDLRRIKAMNLNAVSVFIYHQSLDAQHLLDFLRRCDALGLRVNLSLRPGTPMNFLWDQMKALIEFYRLAQNDTVFAYDLAWEPTHTDLQPTYGRKWNQWVKQKYGNLAQAQQHWNWTLPENISAAELAVPSLERLTQDGAWRKFSVDFRTFLDEQLTVNYGEARRLVKSIDPHHAVSFRMTLAGDPTANMGELYDFYGLAQAVDIWEPEAYGRIGDWEKVKPGRFTANYARLCDPEKPILWAEMGYSVWDPKRMTQTRKLLDFTAQYTADFYRMMTESGADGIFFWWYPGGFRIGENSDYGIINPDGTDRPMTKVIREKGKHFLTAPKPPTPNYFIEIDRDQDARGLFGVYLSVQKEYWSAIAAGKTPGLKWKARPGAAP